MATTSYVHAETLLSLPKENTFIPAAGPWAPLWERPDTTWENPMPVLKAMFASSEASSEAQKLRPNHWWR